MNTGERKEFEEIKECVALDYCFTSENWSGRQVRMPRDDELWLIAALEALLRDFEAAERERDRWIGRNDIDVHEGMAWCDRAKTAEARCAELEALVRELAKWLRAYAPGLCEGLLARADKALAGEPGEGGEEKREDFAARMIWTYSPREEEPQEGNRG